MEIDTGRFIEMIWRRKVLLLSMTAFFVAAASIYSYLTPKVYRVQTVIEASSFESPSYIAELATHNYFNDQVAKKINIEVSLLPKMNANVVLQTNLVAVSIISKNIDQALQTLSALNETVVNDGTELYEVHQRSISLMQKKIKRFIPTFESKTEEYLSDYDNTGKDTAEILASSLLFDAYCSYLSAEYENEKRLTDLKKRKVITPPRVLTPPIWPRPNFIISFAAMAGFLLGIFVAVWKERRINPQ